MKKKIFYLLFSLLIFIPSIILLIPKEEETELSKLEKNNMLAYTIDGASASSMPTKGSGYVVNSITCKNGSELVWDNDNWKVEIVKIEDFDSCVIDFTNDLTKSSPRVTLTQSGTKVVNFDYTGAVQTFTAPVTGSYKLEVWGAQGGSYSTYYGGAGGYSVGTVSLTAGETLYIYVGGQPVSTSATTSAITGGFNGGGQARVHSYSGTTTYSQAGGGATDIRIGQDSLYARVIVAGGGGGSASVNALTTKYGGGTTGGSPSSAFAASQTAGGTNGTFGVGANGYISGYNYKYASGGGGGGWYGGGAVNAHSDSATDYQNQNGGGSGYVYTSSTASNYPSGVLLNSNYYLTNASTIAGNASMPTTDGTGTETGHTGNGYAKITYSISGSVNLNGIDSGSKTTTSGGTVSFYISKKYQVTDIFCTDRFSRTNDNKIIFSNLTSNTECSISLEKIILPTLTEAILRDNSTVSERTDFSVTNVANTTGTIYKTNKTEDSSYVYYYSGNTTNNWVYFGGFYWRIIRTNEDGSIRMLYAGTSHTTTSGHIKTSKFNNSYDDPMYVGYMYGTTGSLANNRTNENDSTIKTFIDTWYKNNLLNNYDKFISKSAIYCNDRSEESGSYNTGSTTFYFGTYTRLGKNKTPSYKCGANTSNGLFESTQAVADKFSASTTGGGNGQLKYPVALMTVDEVSFAGGVYNTRLSSPYTWYYANSTGGSVVSSGSWWLLSPYRWYSSKSNGIDVYGSGSPGRFFPSVVNTAYAVRPVISLSSCVKVTGTGTSDNPYVIDEEDSIC